MTRRGREDRKKLAPWCYIFFKKVLGKAWKPDVFKVCLVQKNIILIIVFSIF